MTTLTKEKIDALKRDCAQLLTNSNVKPKTKTGNAMIYAFWVGVMQTVQEGDASPNPYISICLMSGRYEDLIDTTPIKE